MLIQQPELLRQLGMRARARMLENFTATRFLDQTKAAYQRALD
jgi:hypothetical protein